MNITLKISTLILLVLLSACQKKTEFSKTDLLKNEKKNNIPPAGFFIENRKVPGIQTTITRTDAPVENSQNSTANRSSPNRTTATNQLF